MMASGPSHFRASPRLRAGAGALAGVALTAGCGLLWGMPPPAIVAPIGASAVLVFAVPASPLAQPWPVIGGNTLSALTGIAVMRLLGTGPLGTGPLAAGVAVAAAILVMSLLRCLHPPGGAAALTAVIGGPAVTAAGWSFAVVPVAANSLTLVACGLVFHRLTRHSYPHRARPPAVPPRFLPEDLDAAIEEAGESFDIDRDDLAQLLAAAEAAADRRLARP